MLQKVTGKSASGLLLEPDYKLTAQEVDAFLSMREERESGVPLAYVLGEQDFYGRTFRVTPDVLIPRPETEGLLERALETKAKTVLELCTGSGILAISLAIDGREVTAVDISEKALEVAKENASMHNVHTDFVQSDLFDRIEGKFDLIITNPPYIDTQELMTLDVSRQEPLLALDGGERGMELIERILMEAPNYLNENGLLLMEIGMEQAQDVKKAAADYAEVTIEQDLFKRDRYVIARPGRKYAGKTG